MTFDGEDPVDEVLEGPSSFDPQVDVSRAEDSGPDVGPDFSSEGQPEDEADRFSTGVPEEFPADLRDDLEMMLQGKRLTVVTSWLGHRYTLQQLDVGQMMDVGLVHKQYAGTLGDIKAYQVALLAASVIRVDDDPMPVPPSLKKATGETDPVFLDRFRHVRTWFAPTVDHLYEEYLKLDNRVQLVLAAMGNQSG